MPDDSTRGDTPSNAAWPLPKFAFEVTWDDQVMHFQEVSGLDAEAQAIEYRHGNSPQFSVAKMPGIRKYSDMTMKKGVFKNENERRDWFNAIKMNTIQRKTVTISLLDEGGAPAMVWTLLNAWPTRITGNEVTVEALVFAHEGRTVGNG